MATAELIDDAGLLDAYSTAVVGAVERVARAAPGTRNDTLNAETFSLARLAATGDLDAGVVAVAMASAALAAGLPAREAMRTIGSALRAVGEARHA